MEPHRHSGRWRLGALLTLLTALLWGILPIALKVTLQQMDGTTITGYRMLASFAVLFPILAARRGLPPLRSLGGTAWILLATAAVGLGGNYVLYILGLDLTTPANAQVVIQTAPLFLVLGALLLFREKYDRIQWIGFGVLLAGLGLFFHDQIRTLVEGWRGYVRGTVLVFMAAIAWAAYALAQKQLLRSLSANGILLCIYFACAVTLLPLGRPASLFEMDALHLGTLAFSCVNTLLAYGAFATALAHWDASRISAVLSITPILTMVSMEGTARVWPGLIPPQQVTGLGVLGALLVVGGSMMAALNRR